MTLTLVASAALGAATWTLLEYVIHRWLGHEPRTRPNPFAAEHVRHHGVGDYFAPARKKAIAAAGLAAVLTVPAVTIAGPMPGLAFVVGLVAMYAAYEVVHRRDHTHPGRGRYGHFLRRHHFYHHFVDPHSNHGVTSPVWDWVFGTLRTPGRILVPHKLAMRWLVDAASGDVLPEFARYYEIVDGSKPRPQ